MKKRFREFGFKVGLLPTGPKNKITDVKGVLVGHETIKVGTKVNTGVTIIAPHSGNVFKDKVPASIFVGNGFGKLVGSTQVDELGNIETYIGLTNTLSVGTVVESICKHFAKMPENNKVFSFNAVVGETNDGFLNDIKSFPVKEKHVVSAIKGLSTDFEEGNVGAGTGTRCFAWKGGIGSSSRVVEKNISGLSEDFTVGVLVQTNFGGFLEINGVPVGLKLGEYPFKDVLKQYVDGSCMIVVATDAPLEARQLKRVAFRAVSALGKTGAIFSHGSGDYCIAFSNNQNVLIDNTLEGSRGYLSDDVLTYFFMAVIEAVQESVYNSLFMAETTKGHKGKIDALPVNKVIKLLKEDL